MAKVITIKSDGTIFEIRNDIVKRKSYKLPSEILPYINLSFLQRKIEDIEFSNNDYIFKLKPNEKFNVFRDFSYALIQIGNNVYQFQIDAKYKVILKGNTLILTTKNRIANTKTETSTTKQSQTIDIKKETTQKKKETESNTKEKKHKK